MKALIWAAIALSAAGFGITTWRLISNRSTYVATPFYNIMTYVLMYLITVAIIVICVSVLLKSQYVIDGKTFKTRFGFIVSKYDVEKIDCVTLDRKTNKLTVTFSSGEFIVVVVKQEWYDEFITELLLANPKIEYTVNSLDNSDIDKKA